MWVSRGDATYATKAFATVQPGNQDSELVGTSFSATFVGHHCWVVRAGRSTLLVDPLLGDRFGHSPEAGLRVYPPREVSHAKLPRLSGIFITHEHEGHFDLPSLRLLDKKTPVFIPHGSSTAMHRILLELGFSKVRRLSLQIIASGIQPRATRSLATAAICSRP